MSGLLSDLCGRYYKLRLQLYKRDDRFKELFDNVLKFDQNLTLSELDAIIESGQKAINAYDKTQIAFEKVKEVERRIVNLFISMGVRPNWYLTGEIEGELEYEVWYDSDEKLYVIKTKDLAPLPDEKDIITIKFNDMDDVFIEDDD